LYNKLLLSSNPKISAQLNLAKTNATNYLLSGNLDGNNFDLTLIARLADSGNTDCQSFLRTMGTARLALMLFDENNTVRIVPLDYLISGARHGNATARSVILAAKNDTGMITRSTDNEMIPSKNLKLTEAISSSMAGKVNQHSAASFINSL
jgi:hypothetical protein